MHKKFTEIFYTTGRKPGKGDFYKNAKGKVGEQLMQN